MAIIYKATHIPTGKCYIGKTTRLLTQRRYEHEHAAEKHDIKKAYFHKFLRKYKDEFKWVVLNDGLKSAELNSAEQFQIAFWHSNERETGFNLTVGGDGVCNPSKEVRQRMSKAKKGKAPWNKGKKLPENYKQKIAQTLMGRKASVETCQKLSVVNKGNTPWNKGKKLSIEHRQKLSKANKGKNAGKQSWNKGKKLSEEHKQKLREAKKKAWFVYIIECSDGSYYTGMTTNLDRRITEHNIGKGSKYTRSRMPVTLLCSKQVETRSDALKLEAAVKKQPRMKKVEFLTCDRHTSVPTGCSPDI